MDYEKRYTILIMLSVLLFMIAILSPANPLVADNKQLVADECSLDYETTTDGEIQISNICELENIGEEAPSDGSYVFTQDIEGNDTFQPIDGFTGEIDGQGHTISNIEIESNKNNTGIFRTLSQDAEIRNINIEDTTVEGETNTGIVVGNNRGSTIENVDISGTVEGTDRVGAVAGRSISQIDGANVSADVTGGDMTGGVVGTNRGSVSDVNVVDEVSGRNNTGGVVGYNHGTVSNTFTNSTVTGSNNVGGVVGTNDGTVEQAIPKVTIKGEYRVGGAIGTNRGVVSIPKTQANVKGIGFTGEDIGFNTR